MVSRSGVGVVATAFTDICAFVGICCLPHPQTCIHLHLWPCFRKQVLNSEPVLFYSRFQNVTGV